MSDPQQPQPEHPAPFVAPTPVNPSAPPSRYPAPYAYAPHGYAPVPVPPSRLNVAGLVSLILGSVAFLLGVTFGWIPFVGFLPIALALAGVVLGIVGLVAKNRGRGLAIAGTIVAGVALLIASLITVVMIVAFTSFQNYYGEYGGYGYVEPGVSVDGVDGGGTFADPATIGSVILFGVDGVDEWRIVVGEPEVDVTDEVVALSGENFAPPQGHRYVAVPLEYTNLTSDMGYLAGAVSPALVGADGETYPLSHVDYPDSVTDTASIQPGAVAHVNAVFDVPDDVVADGSLQLTSRWGASAYVTLR